MVAALTAAGRPVPGYLRAAVDELRPRHTERATFAMHCFWSGEACLGELDGIQATRAGFLEGREVVEVTFDPDVIGYEELLQRARDGGCSDAVFTHTLGPRPARLRRSSERVPDLPVAPCAARPRRTRSATCSEPRSGPSSSRRVSRCGSMPRSPRVARPCRT